MPSRETHQTLTRTMVVPGGKVESRLTNSELPPVNRPTRGIDYLRRPDVNAQAVPLILDTEGECDVAERVEIAAKYDGYLDRQLAEAERLRRLEDHSLPADMDYAIGSRPSRRSTPEALGAASHNGRSGIQDLWGHAGLTSGFFSFRSGVAPR